MMSLIVTFQEYTFANLLLPICEAEEKICKELKDKIKKTVKSQDYIYEFLDEM
jgi:hypothetical protein